MCQTILAYLNLNIISNNRPINGRFFAKSKLITASHHPITHAQQNALAKTKGSLEAKVKFLAMGYTKIAYTGV